MLQIYRYRVLMCFLFKAEHFSPICIETPDGKHFHLPHAEKTEVTVFRHTVIFITIIKRYGRRMRQH